MKYRYLLLGLFAFSCIWHPSVQAFSDLKEDYPYKNALTALAEQGVITGYRDGTVKPDGSISRAEFATLLLRSGDITHHQSEGSCFTDVVSQSWYEQSLCYLKEQGVINGYKDGTVKPEQSVTVAEAAAMMSRFYDIEAPTTTPWYEGYFVELEARHMLLPSFVYIGQELTRGEATEMIYRLITPEQSNQTSSIRYDDISEVACQPFREKSPSNIDMKKVRDTWISWYNKERANVGVGPLERNMHLDITSLNWSNVAEKRGTITHKRYDGAPYYDFFGIMNWFKNQFGISFVSKNRMYYGESIAWNSYSCNDDDCTDELIDAIRSSFVFFASEKGKSYRPHYDMMVNGSYKQIGLGVVVDEARHKYWLTTHLATEVLHEDMPYCHQSS